MTKKAEKESCELAIDIATQTTKLFIALSTSILAFTVTFSDKTNGVTVTCAVKTSWVFLGVSIVAGVFVLQKIIGELATTGHVSLYKNSLKWGAIIQNLSFIVGVLWVAGSLLFK